MNRDEESSDFEDQTMSTVISFGEQRFDRQWSRIADNDPRTTKFFVHDRLDDLLLTITNEEWEEFGRDISNNTHLVKVLLGDNILNNNDAMDSFLRGLVGSSSIEKLVLENNRISPTGVRSLEPFLQNSICLKKLSLGRNNLGSDGFNILLRALRDSSIEFLWCNGCGIESIEIEHGYFPRMLKELELSQNNISSDGCRKIAQLLQREDATLKYLNLIDNKIDDNCAAILAGALRINTSLKYLRLERNDGISKDGQIMFLKLLNDVSSITSTIHSNHTLHDVRVPSPNPQDFENWNLELLELIRAATKINKRNGNNPEAAWREKLKMQLDSNERAKLARLQGVNPSLYSEIVPNLLPEALALISGRHGWGELFVSLKSSIADVISIVNRKKCIKLRLAYLVAEVEELHAELKEIELAEDKRAQEH